MDFRLTIEAIMQQGLLPAVNPWHGMSEPLAQFYGGLYKADLMDCGIEVQLIAGRAASKTTKAMAFQVYRKRSTLGGLGWMEWTSTSELIFVYLHGHKADQRQHIGHGNQHANHTKINARHTNCPNERNREEEPVLGSPLRQ